MQQLNITAAEIWILAVLLVALLVIILVAALPKERAERIIRLVRTVLRLLPITAICEAIILSRKKSESESVSSSTKDGMP